MKKRIDIEKLLQWALCEELPKGQAVAASPWDVITQYCALGTRIATGGYRGDGLGFVPGAPHEDALVIAAAVKALDTAGFDHVAQVEPLFGDMLAIAGDAVAAVMASRFDQRSLVISNAMLRKRPAWRFELPTPYQMFAPVAAGRPRALVYGIDADGDVVEVRQNRGRAAQRDGAYAWSMAPRSPLQWLDPAPLHVAEARGEYVAWHAALCALAADLAGRLAEFDPVAPFAPALPWITGEAPAGRVLGNGEIIADADILPPAPQRKAAGRPAFSPIEAESAASYARASRLKMTKVPAA